MTTPIEAHIRTYACEYCGYFQHQDPHAPGGQQILFPEFPGIQDGNCPACYSGRNPQGVKRVSTLELLEGIDIVTSTSVASDTQLEERMVEELDEHGQPIMVQTGERYELRVNQATGQIYSEAVPVYEPKMRELTTQEINELKTQRDDNLRELERIAV